MSSYPTLTVEAARRAFEEHLAERPIVAMVREVTVQVSGPEFEEAESIDLSNVLWELAHGSEKPGYAFERQAASLVHRHLGLHPIVAGDPGFWRWLTFSGEGDLADLVDWRYPGQETGHARDQYFGFGQMKEGMYAYLWLCAQSVLDLTLEDPYELSRRGDVDVWQSHVVRIDFGSVPQLARAFIRFVFPDEESQFLRREDERARGENTLFNQVEFIFKLVDAFKGLLGGNFVELTFKVEDFFVITLNDGIVIIH